MSLYLILDFLLNENTDLKTQKMILEEVKNMAFKASVFKREMAMENFRKDYFDRLPGRLHCLYATTERGIKYWKPRFRSVSEECSEYLVQGRVNVLEKVGEIKKR